MYKRVLYISLWFMECSERRMMLFEWKWSLCSMGSRRDKAELPTGTVVDDNCTLEAVSQVSCHIEERDYGKECL